MKSSTKSSSYTKSSKKQDDLPGRLKEIVDILKQSSTVRTVISQTGRDKRLVSKDMKKLVDRGLVQKIDRGIYKVIHKGRVVPPSHPKKGQKSDFFCLHNLHVELNLTSDHHQIIKAMVLRNRELFNVRDSDAGPYCDFSNVTMLITRDSIHIFYPEGWGLYGDTLGELSNQLYEQIKYTATRMYRRFKVSFFKDGRMNFNIRNMHVALMHNGVAKELKKGGVRHLVVYDDFDGKPRFVVDFSKGVAHLEAVHPEKAMGDSEAAQFFMNTLKDGRYEGMYNNSQDFFDSDDKVSLSQIKTMLYQLAKENKESAAGLNSIITMIRQAPQQERSDNGIDRSERPWYVG